LDFDDPQWASGLRELAQNSGSGRPTDWIDYFVFSPRLFGEVPPFAVGRSAWDNWLVWRATQRRAIVDATTAVTVYHQNHDYAHVTNDPGGAWKGVEAVRNRELQGGLRHIGTIDDARYVMTTAHKIVRATAPANRAALRQRRHWARKEIIRFVAPDTLLRATRPARRWAFKFLPRRRTGGGGVVAPHPFMD
jgi:hypothetical protein